MEELHEELRAAVERELSCSAHDMEHTMRVYQLAEKLAEGDDVDQDVIRTAALLHDIGRAREDNDSTGETDHAREGARMAGEILSRYNVSPEKITHIQDCIVSHRYKTGVRPESPEAKILFDADKLDSLGAIGVARSFVWVGRNNANIYRDVDIDEYARENLQGSYSGRIQDNTKHSPQIEFETKLKHIKDMLHTNKAREIALERERFLSDFLDRLREEVHGRR